MDKTIYATIAALIGEDGSLTEQPRFPENQLTLDNGEVIEYAPGEIDGNILYFNGFGFGPRQAEAGNLLDAAIADLEAGDPYSSRAKFRLFGTSGRMLPAADRFLETLRRSGKTVGFNMLGDLARGLLADGIHPEEVKAGLCIAEFLAENGIRIADDQIRTIARCDEFTLFCIRIAEHFPDSDSALEEMGRHASVWGHIHLSETGGQPPAADLPDDLAEMLYPELYPSIWDDE